MRMRDLIDLIEGRIDELSTDLVKKAQAARHAELKGKARAGAEYDGTTHGTDHAVTAKSLNKFHDNEAKAIDRDHRAGEQAFGKRHADLKDQQHGENERNRKRNMARGKALNTANTKLNGTAKVPSKPKPAQ
jgi:hypothetical protein